MWIVLIFRVNTEKIGGLMTQAEKSDEEFIKVIEIIEQKNKMACRKYK